MPVPRKWDHVCEYRSVVTDEPIAEADLEALELLGWQLLQSNRVGDLVESHFRRRRAEPRRSRSTVGDRMRFGGIVR